MSVEAQRRTWAREAATSLRRARMNSGWTGSDSAKEFGAWVEDNRDRLRRPYALWRRAVELWWQIAESDAPTLRKWAARFGKGMNRQSAMTTEDVEQEARIGAYEGAVRWDPDRGVQFRTYAKWWIQATITRAAAKSFSVRMTHEEWDARISLHKARKRGATPEELRELHPQVGRILNLGATSLETVDRDGFSLAMVLSDESFETLVDAAERAHLLGRVMGAVSQLNEREADVIRRFFICDQRVAQIGADLGISGSRAGVLLKRARYNLKTLLARETREIEEAA